MGDRLRLFGPLGQLKVRLSYRSILAIAGGSGMAPFLSMLAELAEKGNARPVTFLFGARREQDLYFKTGSNRSAIRCRPWKRSLRCRMNGLGAGVARPGS
jgi:NAD(P)H-flavin reductase